MYPNNKAFRPGEKATESGIYHIRHYLHRISDYAVILAGEQFPTCRGCGDRVRYGLFRSAPLLRDLEGLDFGEAPLKVIRTRSAV
jgi:hypothetical protein